MVSKSARAETKDVAGFQSYECLALYHHPSMALSRPTVSIPDPFSAAVWLIIP